MYDVDVEMRRMHRTQVLLDESRYEELKELASREGKSMGQVIRELIELGLERGRARRGGRSLMEHYGFIDRADVPDLDHDQVIYDEE